MPRWKFEDPELKVRGTCAHLIREESLGPHPLGKAYPLPMCWGGMSWGGQRHSGERPQQEGLES